MVANLLLIFIIKILVKNNLKQVEKDSEEFTSGTSTTADPA